jgi:hypothetical protein
MAIWEVKIQICQCVRCRRQEQWQGNGRKPFIHSLRAAGWYIRDRKTLCPSCRERQQLPRQEVE